MGRLAWVVKAVLLVALPFGLAQVHGVSDLPYIWLTGFSRQELEELSYLPPCDLESRIGLAEVPGGYAEDREYRGRAAHAIASYLGTKRWGPEVTLAFGYLKEYLPALLLQNEADPTDIAANYAGVEYALDEARRDRLR